MKTISNLVFIITSLIIVIEVVLVIFGNSKPDNQDLFMFTYIIYSNLYCKIDDLKNR